MSERKKFKLADVLSEEEIKMVRSFNEKLNDLAKSVIGKPLMVPTGEEGMWNFNPDVTKEDYEKLNKNIIGSIGV